MRWTREDFSQKSLETVDAGEEPAVGPVVRRGGRQGRLGGGARARRVSEVYHTNIDAFFYLDCRRGDRGRFGARPLALRFFGVRLSAPRFPRSAGIRHPTVPRVGARRRSAGRPRRRLLVSCNYDVSFIIYYISKGCERCDTIERPFATQFISTANGK